MVQYSFFFLFFPPPFALGASTAVVWCKENFKSLESFTGILQNAKGENWTVVWPGTDVHGKTTKTGPAAWSMFIFRHTEYRVLTFNLRVYYE
ncbi:hypothetical protein HDV62DRAFT_204577 [Trichoderma sp. SZMC 28011]